MRNESNESIERFLDEVLAGGVSKRKPLELARESALIRILDAVMVLQERFIRERTQALPVARQKWQEIVLPWWNGNWQKNLSNGASAFERIAEILHSPGKQLIQISDPITYFAPFAQIRELQYPAHGGLPFSHIIAITVRSPSTVLTEEDVRRLAGEEDQWVSYFSLGYYPPRKESTNGAIDVGGLRLILVHDYYGCFERKRITTPINPERTGSIAPLHPAVTFGFAEQVENGTVGAYIERTLSGREQEIP